MLYRSAKMISFLNFCIVITVISYSTLCMCSIFEDKPQFFGALPQSPDRFGVEIEMNDGLLNQTTLIKEYYEKINTTIKRSVVVSDSATTMQIIYDENQKLPEITVQGSECSKSSSFKTQEGILYINDKPIFLLSTLYAVLPSLEYVYNPELQVEGVTGVDDYVGEYQNENSSAIASYSVQIYFKASNSSYTFPYCNADSCHQLPLKAIVTGNSTITGAFRYQLVFFNFNEKNIDVTEFQIPPGIYCKDWVNNVPFPEMVTDFATGMEMYFPLGRGTIKSQIIYSKALNAFRIDTFSDMDGVDLPGSSSSIKLKVVEIVDFAGGISYTFEFDKEICLKVANFTSENQKDLKAFIAFLTMSGSKDEKLFYVGKREIRNLKCDVWVKQESDGGILEFYLQKNQFVLADGIQQEHFIPIFINESLIVGPHIEEPFNERHFYNFYIQSVEASNFDFPVDCIMTSLKKTFQIEFKANQSAIARLKNETNLFLRLTREKIQSTLGITYFRIQDLLIDFATEQENQENFIVTANFLEDFKNLVPTFAGSSSTMPNDKLYNLLEASILREEFWIQLDSPSGTPMMDIYPAEGINDNLLPTFIGMDSEILLKMYRPFPRKVLKNFEREVQKLTIYDCFQQCMNEKNFPCQSLSYCATKDGICSLSGEHISGEGSENITQSNKCDTYSRFYSQDYKKFDQQQLLPSYGATYATDIVKTTEDCAFNCSQNSIELYYCEGFNACHRPDGTVLCEYLPYHILEVPSQYLVRNRTCTAFSRDYFDDFMRHPNTTVTPKPQIEVHSTDNPENCARLCATSGQAAECAAFEMCRTTEGKVECNLLIYEDVEQKFQFAKSDYCDLYERVHDLPAKHPPSPATTQSATTTQLVTATPESLTTPGARRKKNIHTGFGPGDMAGLAVGMILLGFLLGAISHILLLRFKRVKMQ